MRSLALILTCIAFCCVLAPQSARGSCGDWLSGHSETTVSLDRHPVAQPAVAPDQTSPAWPGRIGDAAPQRPCRGPLCRQSPPSPFPLPGEPTSPRIDRDLAACVRVITPAGEPLRELLVADETLSETCGFPFRIDRPPQS